MVVVSLSDTHSSERRLKMPYGDMVIFGGDCENARKDTMNFLGWLSSLDYKYKIVVAGNHDSYLADLGYEEAFKLCENMGIIYLQDTSIEIEGIKIHGSPWCNTFGRWDFMADENKLAEYWDKIPQDTQLLITHGPAYGCADKVHVTYGGDYQVGSKTLATKLKNLPLLEYHLVGHIHEAYGTYPGRYVTLNSSMFDFYKKELNKPQVFEIY